MNPLLIVAAIGGLLFLFKRKPASGDPPTPTGGPTPDPGPNVAPGPATLANDLKLAFKLVLDTYGADIARNVERIYRLETTNFTSGQFKKTNTPGMRAFGTPNAVGGLHLAYPWKWALTSAGLSPSDFGEPVYMAENAGGPVVPWVVFLSLTKAVKFVGHYLNKYGNNPGRWNSTDPARQATYVAALGRVSTPIVDDLV